MTQMRLAKSIIRELTMRLQFVKYTIREFNKFLLYIVNIYIYLHYL